MARKPMTDEMVNASIRVVPLRKSDGLPSCDLQEPVDYWIVSDSGHQRYAGPFRTYREAYSVWCRRWRAY